ncbi:MAG TPA: LysM peptidoglycan-binding domain-containing protein [Bacilli bacterium]|nr:LysM peptidoglycan-binding domain-containing protein [Bacilli bacterium]
MAEAANNKPAIRIHLDQQVTIDAVRGGEDIEDAAVLTEITGFHVEDEAYVLKGALTITGFLRRESEDAGEELPDAFDDRDVFETADDVSEGDVTPIHERLPFVLQVPAAAQQQYQRDAGILDVNPKVGQWNLYVLGDETVHFRGELVVQGLSGVDGYVFRCGSQEEGVEPAPKLDQLLDQEESRAYVPPAEDETREFEPPFENEWEAQAEHRDAASAEAQAAQGEEQEDDWVIETPPAHAQEFEAARGEAAEASEAARELEEPEEENDIIFTPDPNLVFPMPEPGSDWAEQLREADRVFGEQTRTYNSYYPNSEPFAQTEQEKPQSQPPTNNGEWPQAEEYEYLHRYQQQSPSSQEAAETPEAVHEAVHEEEEDAFVLEEVRGEVDSTDDVIVEEVETETAFVEARKEPVPPTPAPEPAPAPTPPQAVEPTPPPVLEGTEVTVEEETTDILLQEAEHHHEHHDHQEHHEHDDHHDHEHHDDHDHEHVEAEYEFEDEISRTEAVPPVQMIEEPAQPVGGPKISFGNKVQPIHDDSPIKLSSLLGDSRAQASPPEAAFDEPASAPVGYQESGSAFAPSAPLARESSSSSAALQAYEEADENIAPAPIAYAQSSDSAWSAFLDASETKATMKFRIVQEEDNLTDLAEHYRTSPSELARANNLSGQEVDRGQILYIPDRRR